MNELKPEDVTRALEQCVNGECCNECPYYGKAICITRLHTDSLALLREKDAEIERLKKDNNQFADIGKMHSEIRAEATTEFFERVCKEVEQTPNANEFFINAWKEKFDKIAQEMRGKTDG